MPTQQVFNLNDGSSVANYIASGQMFYNMMIALGFVRTADSGQVNWGSVSTLPGNTTRDFDIWYPPSDPLQTGATQFFIKFWYGNSTTSFVVYVQISTSTNGTGDLTGTATALMLIQGNGNAGSAKYECDWSGSGATGRVDAILCRNAASAYLASWFGVERTLDASGNYNSDGVTVIAASPSSGGHLTQQTLVFGSGVGNVTGAIRIQQSNAPTSDVALAGIPVSPLFPSYGKFGNAHTMFAFARSADAAEGGTFTASLYGTSHTWLSTGNNQVPSNEKVCMRYD